MLKTFTSVLGNPSIAELKYQWGFKLKAFTSVQEFILPLRWGRQHWRSQ